MKLLASSILLAASFARAEDAAFSFFNNEEVVYTNTFDDKLCNDMATEKPSLCETQAEGMEQNCAKSCHYRFPYYVGQNLKDDEVYDLSAKRWDGTTLNFDNFDGYITAIVNLPLTCKKKDEVKFIADFHKFRRILPSTVVFVVFPYEMKGYEKGDDCVDFVKEVSLGKKEIYVMKPVKINGESTHPVYKFLKKATHTKTMEEHVGTVFYISPTGTYIAKLEDKGFATFKKYTNEKLKVWEF